jgi:hypothetical protein
MIPWLINPLKIKKSSSTWQACLTTLSVAQTTGLEWNDMMTNERRTGKDMEGRGRGLIKILSRRLPGGTEETPENFSRDPWSPGWDSISGPPEYEPRTTRRYIRQRQFKNQIILKAKLRPCLIREEFLTCRYRLYLTISLKYTQLCHLFLF